MTEPTMPPAPAPTGAPAGAPPPVSTPASPAASASAIAADPGLTLAMGGAGLILLVEVVFGVLLEEYFPGSLVWLLALAVLIAGFVKGRGGEVPLGVYTVVRVAGFAVGLIAVTDLIFEIRNGFGDGALDMIAALAYYLGAAAMAAGAFVIKR